MKIFVKAKANSKENSVEPPALKLLDLVDNGKDYYIVRVKEPPLQGKANDAIAKLLSEYFKIPKSSVTLISGAISKTKVFEINK